MLKKTVLYRPLSKPNSLYRWFYSNTSSSLTVLNGLNINVRYLTTDVKPTYTRTSYAKSKTSTAAKSATPEPMNEPKSSSKATNSNAVKSPTSSSNTNILNDDSTWSGIDDWSTSFAGLGVAPFSDRTIDVLSESLKPEDVEITPDGLLFLPEIKYRRILNRAFGPGGWGLAPRSNTEVTGKNVTREYGLICMGRLVAVARGEQSYFNPEGITTALEGCKSNAMMRCCKDLGIASELWDPVYINQFKKKHCEQKYNDKKKRYLWKRKDRDQ